MIFHNCFVEISQKSLDDLMQSLPEHLQSLDLNDHDAKKIMDFLANLVQSKMNEFRDARYTLIHYCNIYMDNQKINIDIKGLYSTLEPVLKKAHFSLVEITGIFFQNWLQTSNQLYRDDDDSPNRVENDNHHITDDSATPEFDDTVEKVKFIHVESAHNALINDVSSIDTDCESVVSNNPIVHCNVDTNENGDENRNGVINDVHDYHHVDPVGECDSEQKKFHLPHANPIHEQVDHCDSETKERHLALSNDDMNVEPNFKDNPSQIGGDNVIECPSELNHLIKKSLMINIVMEHNI